jgi:hypothetical protein
VAFTFAKEPMLLSFILDPVADLIGDIILFWDKSDTERVKSIQRARNKVLESHDDLMVDSTKNHLLLCTKAGLYLVSRRRAWKTKMTDQDVSLYERRGRRAFSRIERNQK